MATYKTFQQLFDKIRQEFNSEIEKAYQVVATETKDYYVEQFDKASPGTGQGTNDYGTWDKLSDNYVKSSKKKNSTYPNDKLKLSGDLYKALQASDKNWTRTGKGIKLYIDCDYASYHIEGDGVPKRNFFGSTSQLQDRLKEPIEKLLKNINNNL